MWENKRFGSAIQINPKVHIEQGKEYFFLAMEDVEPGRKFNPPIKRRIYNRSSGSKFANNDILFARITPCLENGKVSMVKDIEEDVGFGSTEFLVFRAISEISDPNFVYYLAKSECVRQPAIKSMVGASGRQRADKSVIENLIIHFPDIGSQHRIASILSAYDDLIENNNRRFALLEESMQLLYREWFIHLRFPGHERVRMIDGLPEGWKNGTLGDLIVLNYGKSLRDDARVPGEIPVYGSSGIVGSHNQAIVQGPAIIVGRKGNVGSTFWSSSDCFPIDTVFYITSEQSNPFIFLSLKNLHFVSSDAAVPGLNRNHAYSQHLLVPSENYCNQFNEITFNMIKQMEILKMMSRKLAEARDLLLPRLMSGEIPV